MKIDVYVLCKNEVKLAPFMVDYWRALAEDVNVYVYDGCSSDGTREIFEKYDWIHIIDFEKNELCDYRHKDLKNECWKQSRERGVDFVMVGDFDETIFSYDVKTLREELEKMKKNGGTILAPLSFNIVCDEFPKYEEDQYLHELCVYGFNDARWEAKPILFNPNEIQEINYCMGAHWAKPIGNVVMYVSSKLFLIHCKFIGCEYYIERIANRKISQRCLNDGYDGETRKTIQKLHSDFNEWKALRFTWDEAINNTAEHYQVINDWSPWGFRKLEWKNIYE